jgi:xanthine dehydrogenase accessory factor
LLFDRLRDALHDRRPAALATVIDGPHLGAKLLVEPGLAPIGSLGDPDLDRVVGRDMAGELAAGRTGVRHYGPQGQANDERLQVFIESYAQPPEMLIFGAVDFTAALCRAAKGLGYRVTVCDAREVFATRARFPVADEVVVDWPNRLLERVGDRLGPADAVCVLTHDPKFDVPAIISALATKVGYLGVMGSRATHARRMQRLVDEGVTAAEEIARIMAPIGLDIGARTPEETAVAVCAEIISLRTGRTGGSLRDTTGPIHR